MTNGQVPSALPVEYQVRSLGPFFLDQQAVHLKLLKIQLSLLLPFSPPGFVFYYGTFMIM